MVSILGRTRCRSVGQAQKKEKKKIRPGTEAAVLAKPRGKITNLTKPRDRWLL